MKSQRGGGDNWTYFIILYIFVTVILYIVGFAANKDKVKTAAYVMTAIPFGLMLLAVWTHGSRL